MPVAELFALTNPIAWAKYLNVKSIISILQGKSGKEKSITVYWIWLKCLLPPSSLPLPKLNGPSSCWSHLCDNNCLPRPSHNAWVLEHSWIIHFPMSPYSVFTELNNKLKEIFTDPLTKIITLSLQLSNWTTFASTYCETALSSVGKMRGGSCILQLFCSQRILQCHGNPGNWSCCLSHPSGPSQVLFLFLSNIFKVFFTSVFMYLLLNLPQGLLSNLLPKDIFINLSKLRHFIHNFPTQNLPASASQYISEDRNVNSCRVDLKTMKPPYYFVPLKTIFYLSKKYGSCTEQHIVHIWLFFLSLYTSFIIVRLRADMLPPSTFF